MHKSPHDAIAQGIAADNAVEYPFRQVVSDASEAPYPTRDEIAETLFRTRWPGTEPWPEWTEPAMWLRLADAMLGLLEKENPDE